MSKGSSFFSLGRLPIRQCSMQCSFVRHVSVPSGAYDHPSFVVLTPFGRSIETITTFWIPEKTTLKTDTVSLNFYAQIVKSRHLLFSNRNNLKQDAFVVSSCFRLDSIFERLAREFRISYLDFVDIFLVTNQRGGQ